MTVTQHNGSSLPPSQVVGFIESQLPWLADYWIAYTSENEITAVITDLAGRVDLYVFTRTGSYNSQWAFTHSKPETVETVATNPVYIYSSNGGNLITNKRNGAILEIAVVMLLVGLVISRFLGRFRRGKRR